MGHVCLAATFVFGLGLAWQKSNDRMDKIEDRAQVNHSAALQAVAVAANERDLKLAAITERVVRDESELHLISELRTSVAVIATEMRGLNAQIAAFREEQHPRKPE